MPLVPKLIVTLLLLMYRYVSVMMDEVSVMTMAYKLRAPMQKGIHFSAWGSFLGQLLLRSSDKASELYLSMQLRGFTGEYEYADHKKADISDFVFAIVFIALFVLLRIFNITVLLGNLFV